MNDTEEKKVSPDDQKMIDFHEAAIREFDNIQEALRFEREQCLEDRRFIGISGAQWEGNLSAQFQNKPMLEIDKISMAVTRIENEYRNNRITARFIAKDKGDPGLPGTVQSLFRSDEQDSSANEAYDNAFSEALKGGVGAFRVKPEYEDEEDDENEYQRIRIEPIFDADTSVWFDLNAKRFDKADARFCYVITAMTRDAFEEEYPDEDAVSVQKDACQAEFDWYGPDVVYVAEYYKVERVKETVRVFEELNKSTEEYFESDFEDDPELEERLLATGSKEIRQKTVKRKKVHKYLMSGVKFLKDCGYIAGKNIPIVPCYGHREFIDNIERCRGHVRKAKDSQRLSNMQKSKLAEISAFSSIEKPIFYPEEITPNISQMWEEDNVKNRPYLLKEPIHDETGNLIQVAREYTKSPQIPPALATLIQLTETDTSDILGNQDKGDKIVSNISGKAVQLVQKRLDYQSFIYISNFAKSIKRAAEIWLSQAKEVYVEENRRMKGVGERGEVEFINLSQPAIDENGNSTVENYLAGSDLDVAIEIGPSSESKRASVVEDLTNVLGLTSDPENKQVIEAMIMMNMEGEGIQDVREYFRKKLVRMGALKPTEEDKKEMEQQQPSANDEYLRAEAEKSMAQAKKAEADTGLAIAKTKETEAKTRETKVDTLKTLSEINNPPQSQQ